MFHLNPLQYFYSYRIRVDSCFMPELLQIQNNRQCTNVAREPVQTKILLIYMESVNDLIRITKNQGCQYLNHCDSYKYIISIESQVFHCDLLGNIEFQWNHKFHWDNYKCRIYLSGIIMIANSCVLNVVMVSHTCFIFIVLLLLT